MLILNFACNNILSAEIFAGFEIIYRTNRLEIAKLTKGKASQLKAYTS